MQEASTIEYFCLPPRALLPAGLLDPLELLGEPVAARLQHGRHLQQAGEGAQQTSQVSCMIAHLLMRRSLHALAAAVLANLGSVCVQASCMGQLMLAIPAVPLLSVQCTPLVSCTHLPPQRHARNPHATIMLCGCAAESERYFGLENFGNTCYANSVLQSLYFCQPFRARCARVRGDQQPSAKDADENLLTCLADLFVQVRLRSYCMHCMQSGLYVAAGHEHVLSSTYACIQS